MNWDEEGGGDMAHYSFSEEEQQTLVYERLVF